jgi:hypothetical protein
MTIEGLVIELRSIGYSLQMKGDNIKLRYEREGDPPGEVVSLLAGVTAHKQEIIDFLKREPSLVIRSNIMKQKSGQKGVKEMGRKELTLTATYDKDSKRFHRFLVDVGQVMTGTLYVPKNEPVPDTVTICLRTKGENQKQDTRGSS